MSEDLQSAAAVRRRHAILAARTRRLARPRKAPVPPPTVRCLVCEAAGELFALPALRIARVTAEGATGFVPSRSARLVGIAVVGGSVNHIIDLRALIGAKPAETRGHFVQLKGGLAPTALRVDRAEQVVDLVELSGDALSGLVPAHAAITGFARPPSRALFSDRAIALLDPDLLAASPAPSSGGD